MSDLTQLILARRGPKNPVDPWLAYQQFAELEMAASGVIETFITLLLTNSECSFRCAMCDLWKNTSATPTPLTAIPTQIRRALRSLPPADNIKLYNSGNFFDPRAIPSADHSHIAHLLSNFRRVIVENHPRLTDHRCIEFRKRLSAQLEIALGLETIHPQALAGLNKQMQLSDFDRAAEFLRSNQIDVRAFILIKPPGLDEAEGIEWAARSVDHAIQAGAQCCTMIPVRQGNGYIDQLIQCGEYTEPTLHSIEAAFDLALTSGLQGRIFVDLWDIERFSDCLPCRLSRIDRLRQMNMTQQLLPRIPCEHCS